MRVEIPFVVLNKKGRPVEGASVAVYKRTDYEANANLYPISSATASTLTYTYTTNLPHDLSVGDLITITGANVSAFNVTAAAITAIPTTTSFSVTGGTSNPSAPVFANGQAARSPIEPAPLYLASNSDASGIIVGPVTDEYGRIQGWIEEGQYVITITGTNISAVQYYEAVAANTDSGSFTRAGVTLEPGQIKFGDNTIITAFTGNDVRFQGNEDTDGYSTSYVAYPFGVFPYDYAGDHYYSSNLNRHQVVLAAQQLITTMVDPITNLGSTGSVTINPTQSVSLTSATRALNSTTGLYDYTFTTADPHSLTVGTSVTVTGASNLSYNGEFLISQATRTTFVVPGAPTDPGANSGFTNGLATTDAQQYQIDYQAKTGSSTLTNQTGPAITSGSDTITGVTITSNVPYVGMGISVANNATGADIVPENTASIVSVTSTATNVYSIKMSTASPSALSSSTAVDITFTGGINFTDLVNTNTSVMTGASGNTYLEGSAATNLAGIATGMGVTSSASGIPDGTKVTGISQKLTVNATGGTYTLTYGGQTTSGLNHNSSASTISSALAGLTSIGSASLVSVEMTSADSNPRSYRITITKPSAGYFTASGTSLTGGASTAELTEHRVNLSNTLTANMTSQVVEFGNVFAVNNDPLGSWVYKRADLPKFASAASNTVTSLYGFKNLNLASSSANTEDLRAALNYLVADLKKYGIIS